MGEAQTYGGGCHCGKVRYQAKMDLTTPVTVCNCSMCARTGTMLSFIPATQFTLQSGEDALTDYTFNKGNIHHPFCKVCGIKSFARAKNKDGMDMVAINARCLDDVDLKALKTHEFDGRSI